MAKQNIDFTTAKDNNDRNDAAVQPFTDGEDASAAVLNRPSENLRVRTEAIRKAVDELRYLADADRAIALVGGGTITSSTDGDAFTISEPLYVRPFVGPGAASLGAYVDIPAGTVGTTGNYVRIRATTARTYETTGTGVYANQTIAGANDFTLTVTSAALGASTAPTFTATGTPVRNLSVVLNTTAGNLTSSSALVTALMANTAFTSLGLEAVAVGTDSLTLRTQTLKAFVGGLDAESHKITVQGLSDFFTAANKLANGDTLAIHYDQVTAAANAGRRQSLAGTSVEDASLNLVNLRVNPEYAPLAIPICTRAGDYLIFIDGTRVKKGTAYTPGQSLSTAGGTLTGHLAGVTATFSGLLRGATLTVDGLATLNGGLTVPVGQKATIDGTLEAKAVTGTTALFNGGNANTASAHIGGSVDGGASAQPVLRVDAAGTGAQPIQAWYNSGGGSRIAWVSANGLWNMGSATINQYGVPVSSSVTTTVAATVPAAQADVTLTVATGGLAYAVGTILHLVDALSNYYGPFAVKTATAAGATSLTLTRLSADDTRARVAQVGADAITVTQGTSIPVGTRLARDYTTLSNTRALNVESADPFPAHTLIAARSAGMESDAYLFKGARYVAATVTQDVFTVTARGALWAKNITAESSLTSQSLTATSNVSLGTSAANNITVNGVFRSGMLNSQVGLAVNGGTAASPLAYLRRNSTDAGGLLSGGYHTGYSTSSGVEDGSVSGFVETVSVAKDGSLVLGRSTFGEGARVTVNGNSAASTDVVTVYQGAVGSSTTGGTAVRIRGYANNSARIVALDTYHNGRNTTLTDVLTVDGTGSVTIKPSQQSSAATAAVASTTVPLTLGWKSTSATANALEVHAPGTTTVKAAIDKDGVITGTDHSTPAKLYTAGYATLQAAELSTATPSTANISVSPLELAVSAENGSRSVGGSEIGGTGLVFFTKSTGFADGTANTITVSALAPYRTSDTDSLVGRGEIDSSLVDGVERWSYPIGTPGITSSVISSNMKSDDTSSFTRLDPARAGIAWLAIGADSAAPYMYAKAITTAQNGSSGGNCLVLPEAGVYRITWSFTLGSVKLLTGTNPVAYPYSLRNGAWESTLSISGSLTTVTLTENDPTEGAAGYMFAKLVGYDVSTVTGATEANPQYVLADCAVTHHQSNSAWHSYTLTGTALVGSGGMAIQPIFGYQYQATDAALTSTDRQPASYARAFIPSQWLSVSRAAKIR